jgi:uncharacterized protein YgbK (DUF1537 family)
MSEPQDIKLVILDDDPTGCQTVHGCLLLTRWDADTLRQALLDDAPLFFVLTNTRAMGAREAAELTREVCRNLKTALAALAQPRPWQPVLVSRSDSTLRGHYPVETDTIAEELGPFDAHFLVPAFFEGGRITRDSVHYLKVDGKEVPTHCTEFARDAVFGYRHSFLPDYVEEKTGGRIRASEVQRFALSDVRGNSLERLLALRGDACCVVDAERAEDLRHFAGQLRQAMSRGRRFLFRSAASLLNALVELPPAPVPAEQMSRYALPGRPGAVVVGSHVQKTTQQLEALLQEPWVTGVEVDVELLEDRPDDLLRALRERTAQLHALGRTPVIYTSRIERGLGEREARLAFGAGVSAFLMALVHTLPPNLGFLISKGGITSNDVLNRGLGLSTSRVLGQVLAGCPVVRCPSDHPRHPDMPVVIFPGNVGDERALATVYRRMSAVVGEARAEPERLGRLAS